MRTNKRKLMSLLLTFVMLLSLLPTTALAEEESHPDGVSVTINGNGFTLQNNQYATSSSTTASSGYSGSETYVARYDGTSGTLYLNGYTGGAISATNGSLSIVLDGENTVTVNGGNSNFYGINGNGVALTIQGSGSLTVNATGTGSGSVYGIGGKSVAIAESANVTVNAKTEKTATYAIYAQNSFSTADSGALNLTVEGKEGNGQALYGIYVENGDISLDGSGAKSITMQGVGGMVNGIYTQTSGNTTVNDGSLTLKDETRKENTIAIAAEGVVTLNADVTIEKFKYGVYNSAEALTGSDTADIKITGGSYTFSEGKNDSDGLYSTNNRVAVRGGTVNISAKGSAIVARNGGLDVTGSPTVTLTADGSYASYADTGTNNIDLTGGSVTATSTGTYPIQGAITLGENTRVVKGNYYTSDYSCSGIANSDGTYTVKFEYKEPGAASATVGDVTIEGTTGTAITEQEVTVTLTDAKFKAIAANTDVKDWFTNLPAGLAAKIKTAVNENDTTATITVSGKPTTNSVAALAIKIPAANLVSGTADLTATENANAKFEILTLITEASAEVTAPVAGQTPATTATPGDAAKYKVSVTKWMLQSGTEITSFEAGTKYLVQIKFEALAGYKFANGEHPCTYKINGENASKGPNQAYVPLTASEAPASNISLNPSSGTNYTFESAAPLTVTITNSGTADTGTLTIALDGAGKEAFEVSPTTITNVAKNNGTATFTVTPKAGLAAGNYSATVKVSGSGAGVEERSFTVNYHSSGAPAAIAVPTANTGLVYDGMEKTGVNAGTGYTLSGTYKATDVSTSGYTATATLNSGYKWNDGATNAKTISWNIGKGTLTADSFTFNAPSNLEYDGSNKTASITLKSPLTGAGTITPTYMKGGSVVTETKDVGEYTVKFDVAGGSNFNAASGLTAAEWTFTVNPTTWGVPTESLTAVNPTTADGSDGKITGTASNMQYKKSTDSSWTDCTGEVTGLTAGTYYVRYKADDNHNASDTNYKTLTLTDPGTPPTYSVTIAAGTGMTLTSGNASQTELAGAMAAVVYTAEGNYYFPNDYSSIGTTSGVTVTRNSYTQITVSGTPTADVNITLAGATAKTKETTPTAAFAAESENGGKLSGVDTGMKYSVDGGSAWNSVTGDNMSITNVTTTNGVKVKKPAADTNTKLDSDVQTISVSKAIAPVGVTAVDCTTGSNNNGKLQNVTAEMEYQKSGAATWTGCGGAEVTNLTNGTYYVRVKAIGAVLASDNLSVEIAAYVAPTVYTITFNGNGGTPAVGTMTTTGGKLASLPAATRTGSYSFDGWYTAASGGTKITTAHVFSANTTVYAHWTYTGGGGGGGGSYTPSYTVSVDKTENGTITVSPKSASKGDTVTVTVKPDKGYELDTLKVLDKNGDTVKLTEKNGKYTFTMPAGKVTVKGSFAEEAPEQIFADVPVDAYYYEAVKWAAEKGITGGVGNDLFAPGQPCTRAQIVTFLWRAAGSPEPKTVSNFADVTAGSYYAKAVAWAVENGITSGTGDGKFSPESTCTRAQAVTFLYRASGAPAVSGNAAFSDVTTDAYYAAAVKWAEKNGITGGIGGGLFGSDNDCTRAQIVTFLYRTYQSK